MAIKNIIFDLGGVLFTIDYHATTNAFKDLGAVDFDKNYSQHTQHKVFSDLETGKISADQFRQQAKHLLAITDVSDTDFDSAWNAMIGDFPQDVTEFIIELKSEYRLFLFSNINAIHKQFIDDKFHKANLGREHLDELFEKSYFSHLFGYRKPHPDGFLKILQENDLNAGETLFVDDTIGHIEGAKQTGLHVLHKTAEFHLPELIKLL